MHMQHNKDRNKAITILSTWKTGQPCCKLSTSLLRIILWTRHDSMCFIIAGAHPSTLHIIGNHDKDPSILLPDHLPEVVHCFRQAALCGNVPPFWPKHLIHHWCGLHWCSQSQWHWGQSRWGQHVFGQLWVCLCVRIQNAYLCNPLLNSLHIAGVKIVPQ